MWNTLRNKFILLSNQDIRKKFRQISTDKWIVFTRPKRIQFDKKTFHDLKWQSAYHEDWFDLNKKSLFKINYNSFRTSFAFKKRSIMH